MIETRTKYIYSCVGEEGTGDSCTTPTESRALSLGTAMPSPSDHSSPLHEPQAPRKTAQTETALPAFQLSPPQISRLSISPPAMMSHFEHPLERRRREKQVQLKVGAGGWSHLAKNSSPPQPSCKSHDKLSSQFSPPGFAFCNLVASRSRAPFNSNPTRSCAKKKLNMDDSEDEEHGKTSIPVPPLPQSSSLPQPQLMEEGRRRTNVMTAAARVRMVMAKRQASAAGSAVHS